MPNFSGVWDLRQQGVAVKGDRWQVAPISSSDAVFHAEGASSSSSYLDTINMLSISTLGRSSDFGDLTVARYDMGASSSSTRGLFSGGFDGSPRSNVIDYITMASTGDAIDFGNLSASDTGGRAVSNSSRAVFKIGYPGSYVDTMEFVTISTTGNVTDFGNTNVSSYALFSTCNTTRGVFMGGEISGGISNFMDFITIASAGNATNFGNLNTAVYYGGVGIASSGTYGYVCNGKNTAGSDGIAEVQYITIASTGNAQDFGDLNIRRFNAQSGNKTKGLSIVGNDGSHLASVDIFTMSTSGTGSDWGDLSSSSYNGAALSSTHGGLA
jgi:hypothetical protein